MRPGTTEDSPLVKRHLLIIAKDQVGLYRYVRARFAAEQAVEVILDRRRQPDRRQRASDVDVDRRAADRRRRPHVDAALRLESMHFLTTCEKGG
jgi:hypothetical protein